MQFRLYAVHTVRSVQVFECACLRECHCARMGPSRLDLCCMAALCAQRVCVESFYTQSLHSAQCVQDTLQAPIRDWRVHNWRPRDTLNSYDDRGQFIISPATLRATETCANFHNKNPHPVWGANKRTHAQAACDFCTHQADQLTLCHWPIIILFSRSNIVGYPSVIPPRPIE